MKEMGIVPNDAVVQRVLHASEKMPADSVKSLLLLITEDITQNRFVPSSQTLDVLIPCLVAAGEKLAAAQLWRAHSAATPDVLKFISKSLFDTLVQLFAEIDPAVKEDLERNASAAQARVALPQYLVDMRKALDDNDSARALRLWEEAKPATLVAGAEFRNTIALVDLALRMCNTSILTRAEEMALAWDPTSATMSFPRVVGFRLGRLFGADHLAFAMKFLDESSELPPHSKLAAYMRCLIGAAKPHPNLIRPLVERLIAVGATIPADAEGSAFALGGVVSLSILGSSVARSTQELLFKFLSMEQLWHKRTLVHAAAGVHYLTQLEFPFVPRHEMEQVIKGRLPAYLRRVVELFRGNQERFNAIPRNTFSSHVSILLKSLSFSVFAVGPVQPWLELVDLILAQPNVFLFAYEIRRYLLILRMLDLLSKEDEAKFDALGHIRNPFPTSPPFSLPWFPLDFLLLSPQYCLP